MVPPGLLTCTITALALRLRQPLERLDALAAAADQALDVDPGDGRRPVRRRWRRDGRVNTAPAPTTATMATSTGTTRQNVSLRRIRRRSTIRSASSDMVLFPQC